MKKPLIKFPNLNNYQWWNNHRRILVFGIALSLFAIYIRKPFDNEAKVIRHNL